MYATDFFGDRVQKFAAVSDQKAPVTEIAQPRINEFDRINHNAQLILETTDQGVGTKELTYQATGAHQVAPTTLNASPTQMTQSWDAKFTLSTEGKTTLTYFATDSGTKRGRDPASP